MRLNPLPGSPGGPEDPSDSRAAGSRGEPSAGTLDRKLCQVGGVNLNYSSVAGTLYHIQVEDRGPVLDRATESEVRRVNVIVYANYGEPNAQIVHGRDHDYADIRTQAHNAFIKSRVTDLAAEARRIIEEKEQRQVMRIKALIHEYHITKNDALKKEFEEANTLFPFLFSRAWLELKQEKATAASAAAAPAPPPVPPQQEVVYPLDTELRESVIEIERLMAELDHDLKRLKAAGKADDILLQTCRKLVARAKETVSGREGSEFNAKRLEMMRHSLTTTWRQVKSRLKA
jgi:hypothetical protein